MGSGIPLPNQVPNDGRVIGIPVIGNPTALTPTLQFNAVTNQFEWVAGGGASVNTVNIELWGGTTGSLGTLVLPFDPETDSIIIPDNITLSANNTLKLAKTNTVNLQVPVGKVWTVVLLIGRLSVDWRGSIRAGATANAADGTVLWTLAATITTSERITSEILTLPASAFLTIETIIGTAFLTGSIIIEKPV